MEYDKFKELTYNDLKRENRANTDCIRARGCTTCPLKAPREGAWTCSLLQTTIHSEVLDRLIEHNVITKAEALDLMLDKGEA